MRTKKQERMKTAKTQSHCACTCPGTGVRVDAVVTLGSRGEFVLPKEVRSALGIETGSRLAVLTCTTGAAICCACLVPADVLETKMREVLGPFFETLMRPTVAG